MKRNYAILLIVLVVFIIIGLAYYFFIGKNKQKKISTELVTDGLPVCVPYTQAQQDSDYITCIGSCRFSHTIECNSKKTICNNIRKSVKTC